MVVLSAPLRVTVNTAAQSTVGEARKAVASMVLRRRPFGRGMEVVRAQRNVKPMAYADRSAWTTMVLLT